MTDQFEYSTKERFADVQILRYRLPDFEKLSLKQKLYIFCLSEATLWGRDITFDQNGRYNLIIRHTLEAIYNSWTTNPNGTEHRALETYLKRIWFSNGIYHHYGCEKFRPGFSPEFLRQELKSLGMMSDEAIASFEQEVFPIIFNPDIMPKRVDKTEGQDLVKSSACNYYKGVTQEEVESFYLQKKSDFIGKDSVGQPSFGLNSTLVKDEEHGIHEIVWCKNGKYGESIAHICRWLKKSQQYAENNQQKKVIDLLLAYYETGDLRIFDEYNIAWLQEQDGEIDFINGFIEVYGDPLGLKASWEGIVEYKDMEATRRVKKISQNAQWFEDHSPIDPRFRKSCVKGVTANAVAAAMLGGDEYPSTAIGINLPNADWLRAQYGSKSVTITNLTHAYAIASKGNGLKEEFIKDKRILSLIDRYGDICDNLHTDLHECLGHGSGQLLPETDPDALKAYGSTIEEARADLFGLYYIADKKLLELGLLDDEDAYKAQYYEYILNGLMIQLVRIKPGHQLEEAHMRNRALISRWALAHGKDIICLTKEGGKTYLHITDYVRLRQLFAELLAEIQRIKSEGDYEAAKRMVETYAVKVDKELHSEVLQRYENLHIAPYKGFLNPRMRPIYNDAQEITDIELDYSETYVQQMLRYSRDYASLDVVWPANKGT